MKRVRRKRVKVIRVISSGGNQGGQEPLIFNLVREVVNGMEEPPKTRPIQFEIAPGVKVPWPDYYFSRCPRCNNSLLNNVNGARCGSCGTWLLD
jgi:predicted ATPase